MKAGVAGIVTMEGELRDKREETDLSTRKLRRTLRAFGNVPLVHTRVLDAIELVRKGASKARIVLKGRTEERTSHNVVATVLGTERPEEIVSFGAHYDSVAFSKGVYDNGAGSVINMEILRHFVEHPPKRTVKFMWYGSEEIGLEGSWAYVKAHKEELEHHLLMINVDVGGPVLGVDKITATAEDKLATYLEYFVKLEGFAAQVKQGIYSSDSISLRRQRRARGELQPGWGPGGFLHSQPVRHPQLPLGGDAGEDHPPRAGLWRRHGQRRRVPGGAEDSPEHCGAGGEVPL